MVLVIMVSLVYCGGIGDTIGQWNRMAINDEEAETATECDNDERCRRIVNVQANCPDGYVVDFRGNCREQF